MSPHNPRNPNAGVPVLERDQLVLDYYRREAEGKHENEALAGLTLEQFRIARMRLLDNGALVRPAARYMPADFAATLAELQEKAS